MNETHLFLPVSLQIFWVGRKSSGLRGVGKQHNQGWEWVSTGMGHRSAPYISSPPMQVIWLSFSGKLKGKQKLCLSEPSKSHLVVWSYYPGAGHCHSPVLFLPCSFSDSSQKHWSQLDSEFTLNPATLTCAEAPSSTTPLPSCQTLLHAPELSWPPPLWLPPEPHLLTI